MDTSPTESQFTDLVCGVCSAPAHGYNFDQITCESCKAFFRRNALRSMVIDE
jgi:nuclear receptor subfamily 1 group I